MLVSSGADIRVVQEILGHASILSTQVYTRLPIQKRGRHGHGNQQITRIVADSAGTRIPIKK
jgi:integrase